MAVVWQAALRCERCSNYTSTFLKHKPFCRVQILCFWQNNGPTGPEIRAKVIAVHVRLRTATFFG